MQDSSHASPGRRRTWTPVRRTHLGLGCALCLLVAVCLQPAWGQEGFAPPTIAEIESRLAEVSSVDTPERPAAEAAYKQALDSLRAAEQWAAKGAEFARLDAEAPERLARFRAEVASPLPGLPEPAVEVTPDELAQGQLQAENAAKAARDLVDKLRAETALRTERRGTLPGHTARLRQQLTALEEALRGSPPPDREPARAQRARLLAERAALATELEVSERELTSYDKRQDLLLVRRDRAQRLLSIAERDLEFWKTRAEEERRRSAERATAEAERLRLQALSRPRLQHFAETNRALAGVRTQEGGLVDQLETLSRELTQVRADLADLRESFRALRRRERAAGLNEAMGVILRRRYAELRDPFVLRRELWATQSALASAELASIEYEEEREAVGDGASTLKLLEGDSPLDPVSRDVAEELIEGRRALLAAVLSDSDRLLVLLGELEHVRREFEQATSEFRDYMEERILWVGSTRYPLLPSPGDAAGVGTWFFSAGAWGDALIAVGRHLRNSPSDLGRLLLGLVALLACMILARGRLSAPPQRVDFALTLRKLLRALFIAAPLPGLAYLAGWALGLPPGQAGPAAAVGVALCSLAVAVYSGWVSYHILASKGVGSDLRWPSAARGYVRKHLLWLIPAKASCTALVVFFDNQPHTEWTDSFGRLAFCAGALVLAVFFQRVLRTQSPVIQALRDRGAGWTLRLRPLWYSLFVIVPLGLCALAAGGYAYTAARLERSLLFSLLAVFDLAILYGLLIRWLLLARRRLAQRQAETAAATAAAAAAAATAAASAAAAPAEGGSSETPAAESAPAPSGPPVGSPPPTSADSGRESTLIAKSESEAEALDLAAIREQAGRLFRSLIAVALVISLYFIWSDVLPALTRLEQVQLWPTVDWVERQAKVYPALERPAELDAAPAPTENGAEPASTSAPSLGSSPLGPLTASTSSDEGLQRVTLLHLGAALVVFLVTLLVGRNLPALLELSVLQRLPLDAGARYALITITRYVVVFFGITVACGYLGITWSSIQWLAAALTFGLAFGLQEIFANFVSGLILLAERPIRVGDVVTVGTVNGKITRIRIRATTVQQWNGKELVIPNKNFVTGEVVNWTLSDPTQRLEIPVGVAYGSDVPTVLERMLAIARAHESVLAEPEPMAVYLGFGASSLDLELRVWIPDPSHIVKTRGDLLSTIQRDFEREGIQIAFPQHDLHVRSGALEVRLANPPQALDTGEGARE